MTTDNDEQIAFWNGPGAARWVRNQQALDDSLEPFGEEALRFARVQGGERILDVGCGCGATSVALADASGLHGMVLGVDVSHPMVAVAREEARSSDALFVVADASTLCVDDQFDLVFSRFGVMFFRDPVGAFSNLHRALRSDGRLTFVCWGPVAENPWYRVPLAAAGTVVPLPAPPDPEEPGPFSLADGARIRHVLGAAGFRDIAVHPSHEDYVFGPDLDTASAFAVEAGPVSRLLIDCDEPTRARVRVAVREALSPHLGANGVRLGASTWIVQARAEPRRRSLR